MGLRPLRGKPTDSLWFQGFHTHASHNPAQKGGTPILPGKGVMRAHVCAKRTNEHEGDETDKGVMSLPTKGKQVKRDNQ